MLVDDLESVDLGPGHNLNEDRLGRKDHVVELVVAAARVVTGDDLPTSLRAWCRCGV